MTAGLRVTVAVPTYRRPTLLAGLLTVLLEQAAAVDGPAVDVLVIDNDPAGSARAVVAAAGAVRYVAEPTPGISAARNRALAETADTDVLVFIDDDERPEPGWLGRLLQTRTDHAATAVAGRVVSRFERPLDPWVAAGGFFERRQLAPGAPISVAATNNLLLDLRRVRALGLRFDARFGSSGGEDTLFTRELAARGEIMVWCPGAVVVDLVPPERMTRRWVLARAYSSGNSLGRVEVALAAPGRTRWLARARTVGLGLLRVAGGTARLVVGTVVRSVRWRARGTRTLWRGAGFVTGALDIVYEEYRRD